jgi:hypothetical protein
VGKEDTRKALRSELNVMNLIILSIESPFEKGGLRGI